MGTADIGQRRYFFLLPEDFLITFHWLINFSYYTGVLMLDFLVSYHSRQYWLLLEQDGDTNILCQYACAHLQNRAGREGREFLLSIFQHAINCSDRERPPLGAKDCQNWRRLVEVWYKRVSFCPNVLNISCIFSFLYFSVEILLHHFPLPPWNPGNTGVCKGIQGYRYKRIYRVFSGHYT